VAEGGVVEQLAERGDMAEERAPVTDDAHPDPCVVDEHAAAAAHTEAEGRSEFASATRKAADTLRASAAL
jgi:hypothetical protein